MAVYAVIAFKGSKNSDKTSEIDKKTNTVKMNQFEHYCDYITNNW